MKFGVNFIFLSGQKAVPNIKIIKNATELDRHKNRIFTVITRKYSAGQMDLRDHVNTEKYFQPPWLGDKKNL